MIDRRAETPSFVSQRRADVVVPMPYPYDIVSFVGSAIKACAETMQSEEKEILEVVDRDGNVVGLAARSELHGNPSLIHRVVHILVFNTEGALLLQKRSATKDVAPGKWDTSVGGHVNPGEELIDAAKREMEEELGISDAPLDFLYSHFFSNHVESELVSSFACIYDGEINYNRDEIEQVAFWDLNKIKANLGKNVFSGQFEEEIARYVRVKCSISGRIP
jgi:isopentenyldiphosphate isomerase